MGRVKCTNNLTGFSVDNLEVRQIGIGCDRQLSSVWRKRGRIDSTGIQVQFGRDIAMRITNFDMSFVAGDSEADQGSFR